VDGEDLRQWPLAERKRRLRRLIPSVPTRLLYVDHVQARGSDFFEVACAYDLEGIVGKLASGRYHADGTSTNWCKIKNPAGRGSRAADNLSIRPMQVVATSAM
jgi:bifunctional non-homologous end joining protein LigD